jgi:hypothetical protein
MKVDFLHTNLEYAPAVRPSGPIFCFLPAQTPAHHQDGTKIILNSKGRIMKITDLLKQDAISVELKSTTKEDILSELAELLVNSGDIKKPEKMISLKGLRKERFLALPA